MLPLVRVSCSSLISTSSLPNLPLYTPFIPTVPALNVLFVPRNIAGLRLPLPIVLFLFSLDQSNIALSFLHPPKSHNHSFTIPPITDRPPLQLHCQSNPSQLTNRCTPIGSQNPLETSHRPQHPTVSSLLLLAAVLNPPVWATERPSECR